MGVAYRENRSRERGTEISSSSVPLALYLASNSSCCLTTKFVPKCPLNQICVFLNACAELVERFIKHDAKKSAISDIECCSRVLHTHKLTLLDHLATLATLGSKLTTLTRRPNT